MAAPWYNVFVGAETGLLKGVNVVKSYWDNVSPLQSADKEKEIVRMVWNDDDQSQICVGRKNKHVFVYNTTLTSVTEELELDGGEGKLKGLLKYEDKYMTATDTGRINLWENGQSITEISAGANLYCLSKNTSQPDQIATGGKENEMKLWDISKPEAPTFTAKNVKNDWLNLHVPIWITGVEFLPENKVVTCTGYHKVRVYDPKAQRRPVLDMEFDEYPLTAMSVCPLDTTKVIVGNTQGKMALLDIRNGKTVQIYKGFAGGIRSIQCHKSRGIVGTCGLDRFFRVHDINSRELLYKVYLKSRLNCVLLSDNWLQHQEGEGEDDVENTENVDVNDQVDEEPEDKSDDELWEAMDVVKTKTVKKTEVEEDEEIPANKSAKRKGSTPAKRSVKKKKVKAVKSKGT